MSQSRKYNKKLYNYIVNTLGVNRQMVQDYIELRLTDIVHKVLKDKLESNYFQKLVLNQFTNIMKEGFSSNEGWTHSWNKTQFDVYLKSLLRNVVENKVNTEMELQVKIVPKDKKVIAKV